ncbi:RNA polymerase sigma factor [Amycolatopsis sp. Hca4]|uniref:RNA polymerase sigma factor n=1 Tax=Amycolatopsis sp. Hca4 TaxID=2742131 RepID=UPI00159098EF|nr:RNA polymerase sigma factor [Amycolatopsis sp. Hca4]QKV73018.1 RNA polymerase sigma factor [Amycolatopsis sp. Hca4]
MTRIVERLDRPDLAARDPREIFARLFDEYAPPLRGYLAGRVGVHVADDLVAETFVVALRRRASYDPERAPVRGWLYGIATNLLRNHVRQEVRGFQLTARAGVEDRPAENHDAAVAGRVDAAARLRVLAAELAALSEQDRDVLLLTSWAGLEPAEVAEALGVPASTVRSRLHRVRHRLQALLVPTEENPK